MINDYENYVGYPHKFEVMIMKFKLKITRGTQTLWSMRRIWRRMIVKFHFIKVKLSFVLVCCYGFWYSLFYNLLYCLCCFVFSFCCLLFWFMLLFSIRCCSPVFGINPIEFACIIMWAVRWERRGSNRLTISYHQSTIVIGLKNQLS